MCELTYEWSYDGGATWSQNVALSPPFDSWAGFPVQAKLGDHYDVKSDVLGADVAYAAIFNGEQAVHYVCVFPDCNGNGISDPLDVLNGTDSDANGNDVPDECELGLGSPTRFSGPLEKRP